MIWSVRLLFLSQGCVKICVMTAILIFFIFFLQIKWKYNIGTSRSFHRVYKYWPNTSFNTDCIVVAFLAMLAVTIIWCLQLLIICDSLNSAIYKYINFSFIFLVYFFIMNPLWKSLWCITLYIYAFQWLCL